MDSGRGSSSAGAGHCSPGRHPVLLVTVRGKTGLAPHLEEGKSCWAHLLAKDFLSDNFSLTVEMELGCSWAWVVPWSGVIPWGGVIGAGSCGWSFLGAGSFCGVGSFLGAG